MLSFLDLSYGTKISVKAKILSTDKNYYHLKIVYNKTEIDSIFCKTDLSFKQTCFNARKVTFCLERPNVK
jgi:hypothetical protein